jgi:hypothetical protein
MAVLTEARSKDGGLKAFQLVHVGEDTVLQATNGQPVVLPILDSTHTPVEILSDTLPALDYLSISVLARHLR